MAVQFKGGVILGADSRTTMGSYIVCLSSSILHEYLTGLRPTVLRTSSHTFTIASTVVALVQPPILRCVFFPLTAKQRELIHLVLQAVADIVHYYLGMYGITNDEPPTTQTAAAIFQEICYSNKDSLR